MLKTLRNKKPILTVACLGVLLSLSTPLAAAPVLDQAYDVIGGVHFNGGTSGYQWQQGVTAGLSGLLTSVELNFVFTGSTRVFINVGAPWQTDSDDFSSAVSVSPGWQSIDVSSAGIHLAAGDVFSIGVEGFGNNGIPSFTGYQGDGTYPGGALFYNGQGYTNGATDSDMNFRTYVDTAVVPLPATAYLLGACLMCLVPVFGRRRIDGAAAVRSR